MKQRMTMGLAAAALAATAVAPASAAPAPAGSLKCTGDAHGVTVAGNVLVPNGASCWLDHTKVLGTVTVVGHGRLVLDSSTVTGGISDANQPGEYGPAGFVAVVSSTVKGSITTGGATSTYLSKSSVRGNLVGNGGKPVGPISMAMANSSVAGITRLKIVQAVIVRSRLATTSIGTGQTGILVLWNSRVTGAATLADFQRVCGTAFAGNVVSKWGIGNTFGTNGPTCAGNAVRGSLRIEGWQAVNRMSGNQVTGDASATLTMGRIEGSGNVFKGTVSGALTTITPATVPDETEPSLATFATTAQQTRDAAAA